MLPMLPSALGKLREILHHVIYVTDSSGSQHDAELKSYAEAKKRDIEERLAALEMVYRTKSRGTNDH